MLSALGLTWVIVYILQEAELVAGGDSYPGLQTAVPGNPGSLLWIVTAQMLAENVLNLFMSLMDSDVNSS